MTLPNTEEWMLKLFSTEGIFEAKEDLQLSFHDPCGHSQFFKRSHILPQGCWIPHECLPTPEEITAAKEELSLSSERAMDKAILLLSDGNIPHDQHEYTLVTMCDLCQNQLASQCLVCSTALCNSCRNNLYTYKKEDGTPITVESHPVQCHCNIIQFQLALMKA